MNTVAFDEVVAKMGTYIEQQVKVGCSSRAHIVESAVATFDAEFIPALLRPKAEERIEQEIETQCRLQTQWPPETDCDRLEKAFDELQQRSIVAVQNAVCCQSCAMEDVWFGIETMRKAGIEVRGYTFFHEQDTEAALVSQDLFLAYGSMKDGKEEALKIGHEVAELLQAYGFDMQWNGEIKQRIKVNLIWQKRWTQKNTE